MIREIHARSTRTGSHFFRAILVSWVFAGPGYAQVEVKAITGADMQAIKESYRKGDYARVVRDLTPLAERGDMEAQYQLALMYANGRGVARDQTQAATWFEKATAMLDPGAQFNLGIMYFEGQGVPGDYEQAAHWFKRAGERGDSEALFNLGLMYDDGKGVRRDMTEAVLLYKRAAELGLKQAQLMLAGMYRDGAGVSKDETLAYLWYAMAAEQDDKGASAERDRLAKRLTPTQFKEAIRMLHELQVQGHVRGGKRRFSSQPEEMQEYIINHEAAIRLAFFAGVFAILCLWEFKAPTRALALARAGRWSANLAVVALNTVLLRLVFPGAAVGMALFAQRHGWGVLNYIECPEALAFVISVIVLDFAIYLQHVMFHALPLLWRLHRVHHADLDFDVSTGTRFHPLEILLSMVIKYAVIAALGPSAAAVLAFEVLLNATSMFNHSNVRMPAPIDHCLRWLVVTPDMHRVHHSIEEDETNSNFGFNLPWWDRLFGTYRHAPRKGHTEMILGIQTFRDPLKVDRLGGMLILPFIGKVSGQAASSDGT